MNAVSLVAVIDIGSNSVRLVIYDALKRCPVPVFNEKRLCGLARGMGSSGKLHPEGVTQAEQSIGRFIALAEGMGVQKNSIHIFATAAVRDAADGKNFVQCILKEYQVRVQVFSGEEEARYAGLGVLSSVSLADGLVGDLGGGSLELLALKKGKTGEASCSLPIGPLRLFAKSARQNTFTPEMEKEIQSALETFPLESKLSGKTFYAVGGAFRNLAKLHMERQGYPLRILHHYTVSAKDLLATIKVIERMPEKALHRLAGISSKRVDLLPVACAIMRNIIEKGKALNVVFSTAGVREGFLYSLLPSKIAVQDPLIAGAADTALRIADTLDYSRELFAWMRPLFPKESKEEQRLRMAACLLCEISRYENTEYRAEMGYRMVMDSSLMGITHHERVFLAKTMYHRYRTQPNEELLVVLEKLLTRKEILIARRTGYAMRLAKELTGCGRGILPHIPIRMEDNQLILIFKKSHAALCGEVVEKRFSDLAELMDMRPVIRGGKKA